jgi:hypothetical protein
LVLNGGGCSCACSHASGSIAASPPERRSRAHIPGCRRRGSGALGEGGVVVDVEFEEVEEGVGYQGDGAV